MVFKKKTNGSRKVLHIEYDTTAELLQKLNKEVGNEIKEWLEANVGETIINSFKEALETPPIWWQWLMLFVFGVFAGIGLGILIAYKFMSPHIDVYVTPQLLGGFLSCLETITSFKVS